MAYGDICCIYGWVGNFGWIEIDFHDLYMEWILMVEWKYQSCRNLVEWKKNNVESMESCMVVNGNFRFGSCKI